MSFSTRSISEPYSRLRDGLIVRNQRKVRLVRMLLSFQMLPEQPAPELLDGVALADGLGYHGCYSADEIYHKDAWLLFAALAQRTEQIRLGPCVAPIYMREPTYVAQLAATLDELSDGRAEVVFGIGNIAMLEQYGVEWRGTRPIARPPRHAHRPRRGLDRSAPGLGRPGPIRRRRGPGLRRQAGRSPARSGRCGPASRECGSRRNPGRRGGRQPQGTGWRRRARRRARG